MTRDERDLWADAAWMARCARGSSWPADMAQRVEDAADRVIAHEAALRATPADDPGEHGNISCPKCGYEPAPHSGPGTPVRMPGTIHHSTCPTVPDLRPSPELLAQLAEIRACERRAWAAAQTEVIG